MVKYPFFERFYRENLNLVSREIAILVYMKL